MGRSLNKVTLIGNLTKDPELRQTNSGSAVCSFTIATNWVYRQDEKEVEETEFHRCVAWNKLAELCNQFLKKGSRTYVGGRIQTKKFTGQDGLEKEVKEIVVDDMIVLDKTKTEEE